MNNRRGTPSGDGRGRGRGDAAPGARGGAGSRGGSGAPRGGSSRGGARGGFRGAGDRRDAFRSDERRGTGDRGAPRGGRGAAGSSRDDDRDFRSRDDSRSSEGGPRGGSSGFGGSRGGSSGYGGSRGGSSYGGSRGGSSGFGGSRGGSSSYGGARGGSPGASRSRYGRPDEGRGPSIRAGRGGSSDDRRPGSYGDDRRGGFRADREGSSGGYRGGREGASGDRRGGFRGAREGSSREGRGGYGGDRGESRGGYGGDRGESRGGYGGDRGESRRFGGARESSYGGRPAFRGRDDQRAPFRADRAVSGERYGRDETGRGGPVRDRSEFRSESRSGSRHEDAPRGGSGGRYERGDRRDEVQTIGSPPGGSRGRYGRSEQGRGGAAAGRTGSARTGAGAGRTGAGARRPGAGGDGPARGGQGRGGRPQAPRAGRGGVFKTARQPLRDPDFFPSDYTDERDTTEVPDGVRLQKVLAAAGVAARRTCEEMIGEGRVTVDGQVVRRFGARVDPAKQVIHVDGKRIPTAPDQVYFAINKPIGVISTMSDPEGRPSLADYVADRTERLFHVGRLDTETEGLIILTNDGELAHRLTHPSFGVQKKYWAKVPGPIARDLGKRLKNGVELEDGLVKADEFKIVQEHGQQALVEVVLHEGRKHVVRRMLEAEGHPVIDLARIEFGPVKLGRLKPGTMRALTLKEVGDLYAVVGL
ncbi:pseudouridine synthase [Sphaerisporangium album]|uniref:Pseudouridine synthase n=1 Tax=Sphaerisporangium album TaxID=509200 RepID=A0A367FRR7_9ACTN|nr:pseudouridine synthase [Sphaerisporangium album]RCG33078.1 pseudouridine synthase [Sphaerisporangium album]